jgi:DNA-binding MarR family transcriptional regulator
VLLRLLHQHWSQAIEVALEKAGFEDIRPHHANVVTFLTDRGRQVSELTRLAHVRKQTMAQAVEELERLGYVERRPDPNDRRARLVFLTDKGRSMRPVTMAAGRRVDAQWARVIGRAELETLRATLQQALLRLSPDE